MRTFDLIDILYLPWLPTDGSLSVPNLTERLILMSTYEEFMILLTFASLVVAILNLKNKK